MKMGFILIPIAVFVMLHMFISFFIENDFSYANKNYILMLFRLYNYFIFIEFAVMACLLTLFVFIRSFYFN